MTRAQWLWMQASVALVATAARAMREASRGDLARQSAQTPAER